MYIIVRRGEMPYYAGTDINGVISWSSDIRYAKPYEFWAAARIQVRLLRQVSNDRSIRTKGQTK